MGEDGFLSDSFSPISCPLISSNPLSAQQNSRHHTVFLHWSRKWLFLVGKGEKKNNTTTLVQEYFIYDCNWQNMLSFAHFEFCITSLQELSEIDIITRLNLSSAVEKAKWWWWTITILSFQMFVHLRTENIQVNLMCLLWIIIHAILFTLFWHLIEV